MLARTSYEAKQKLLPEVKLNDKLSLKERGRQSTKVSNQLSINRNATNTDRKMMEKLNQNNKFSKQRLLRPRKNYQTVKHRSNLVNNCSGKHVSKLSKPSCCFPEPNHFL